MYRNTYVNIYLSNIKNNVKKVIEKHKEYNNYIGVVKADSYGHCDNKVVKAIIDGGCNYLAVATLDEALEIRNEFKDIPILCLGLINEEYIDVCLENDVAITVDDYQYVKNISNKKIKVHIKINTGMNRLGVKTKEEFNKIYNEIINSSLILEGIYTHMYNPDDKLITKKQEETFEHIVSDINLNDIKMIHLGASQYTLNYPKKKYVNTCRLGIIIYGLVENDLNLKSTFSLESEVIKINTLDNESVGYDGKYKATNKELIAVVPIGYADGIIRKNTGRTVFINNKEYPIVGNICMDMMFVKIDESVSVHDKVIVLKDIDHIIEVSNYLETIPYEIICSISKRVPRIYLEENEENN